jgi:hypothetical protein
MRAIWRRARPTAAGPGLIDKDEPISLRAEPTDEEALSLEPGRPGSLVLFKGRLTLKPYAPPPVPTAPVPAKTTAGLFYDRR